MEALHESGQAGANTAPALLNSGAEFYESLLTCQVIEAGALALADTAESSLPGAARSVFRAMLDRMLQDRRSRHLLLQALSE